MTEGSTNPVQNGAIYDFVNSSVATNTAYFIGTFNSVQDLENYSGEISNNDYAFVISTDSDGNTVYNRYKYNSDTSQWSFEYALNNSSFTAAQWATIQSGLTAADKTKLNTIEENASAVGKKTEGTEYNFDGQTITASAGAEIFNSYSGGSGNKAAGRNSHAEGQGTLALSEAQHAQGKYNVADSNNKFAFIIGNGTSSSNRHNAFAVDWNGKIYVNGSGTGIDVSEPPVQITPAEVRSLWMGDEVALIPTMTSASDTIGAVSYGNSYGSGMYGIQDPWLPFDGNDSTCLYYMNENVTDGWLQYEFNTPKLVTTIKALFGNYLASNNVSAKLYVYDANGTEIEKGSVVVTGWSEGSYGEYTFPVNMTISKFKFVFGYKQNATNIMTYTVQAYTLAT